MLSAFVTDAGFAHRFDVVCDRLGADPLERVARDPDFINRNVISSLLVVLASVLMLDRYRRGGAKAGCVAGYSVGMYTGLYAAGVIDYERLIHIVHHRATLMDACLEGKPSGMIAVIGLAEKELVEICKELEEEGLFVRIANYNSLGQYSLAATDDSIEPALKRIAEHRPRMAVRLPVAGAWHCDLLGPASDGLASYLADVPMRKAELPIVDNVTGYFLPEDPDAVREALVAQMTHPVRWEMGIRTLLESGFREFIEIGHGRVLTKYGFFIDRRARHYSYADSALEV
jgi:[acyl-carrier-protein] S-malonyltransferase